MAQLPSSPTRLLAHVGIETYSVLTRLPPPHRVAPDVAREFLRSSFAFPVITLPARGYDELLRVAAQMGLTGGAIYDALVGATARSSDATLLTLDARAASAYQIVDARYRLLR